MQVAPLAGAWIETDGRRALVFDDSVAPLAGAWIETQSPKYKLFVLPGRAPRGRVD